MYIIRAIWSMTFVFWSRNLREGVGTNVRASCQWHYSKNSGEMDSLTINCVVAGKYVMARASLWRSMHSKKGERNHNTITAPTIEPINTIPALTERRSQLGSLADLAAEELQSLEVNFGWATDEEAVVPVLCRVKTKISVGRGWKWVIRDIFNENTK